MPKVSSMAELARIAHCSVMTVSYALRDSPQVSAATRERIQRLAQEHGYRKHPFVSALMATRRSRQPLGVEALALLTKFDQPISRWTRRRQFYSELHDGMTERAAELGFRLEEFPASGAAALDGRQLTRVLRARGIRGVILMPGGSFQAAFPDIDPSSFAMIAAAFHAREMPIHRTASDYGAGMQICLDQASSRGYRRIGLAMNLRLDPHLRHAVSGRFFSWQIRQPKKNQIPLVPGEEDPLPEKRFLKWFEKHQPDCIICASQEISTWLTRIGVKIPHDVGLCFMPVRGVSELSGFDSTTHQVGCTSINLLARELLLNHSGLPESPEVNLVGGRWQEGLTLRAQSASVER